MKLGVSTVVKIQLPAVESPLPGRKQKEKALESHLENLPKNFRFPNLGEGLLVKDPAGRFTLWRSPHSD